MAEPKPHAGISSTGALQPKQEPAATMLGLSVPGDSSAPDSHSPLPCKREPSPTAAPVDSASPNIAGAQSAARSFAVSDQEALSMAAPAASPAPPYVPASPLPMRSAAEHCIPTFVPSQHGGSFDNAISQNLSSATPGAARSSSASVPSHQALPPAVPLSGPRDTFSMRMQDPVWRMWMDHWFTMDIKTVTVNAVREAEVRRENSGNPEAAVHYHRILVLHQAGRLSDSFVSRVSMSVEMAGVNVVRSSPNPSPPPKPLQKRERGPRRRKSAPESIRTVYNDQPARNSGGRYVPYMTASRRVQYYPPPAEVYSVPAPLSTAPGPSGSAGVYHVPIPGREPGRRPGGVPLWPYSPPPSASFAFAPPAGADMVHGHAPTMADSGANPSGTVYEPYGGLAPDPAPPPTPGLFQYPPPQPAQVLYTSLPQTPFQAGFCYPPYYNHGPEHAGAHDTVPGAFPPATGVPNAGGQHLAKAGDSFTTSLALPPVRPPGFAPRSPPGGVRL